MDFDRIIERRGTHSMKWDAMQAAYGVSPGDGLAMWVADMDFAAPDCVQRRLREMLDNGVYGYFGDDRAYREAIIWWMKTRHGWAVEPSWINSTHGLVNGSGLCFETWTKPGDGVVLFTPVYHSFAKLLRISGRDIMECEMAREEGRYTFDTGAWDAQMRGHEKLAMLVSPHNPGGQCWSADELRAIADFCIRHDLILVSDEIHHDLVMPHARHIPMPLAAPHVRDRLVMMTATTKTFNIAGSHIGNVIIENAELRAAFEKTLFGLGLSPNAFGLHMAEVAYSPEGAEWVDALVRYLDGNRRLLDQGINAIPGLKSMPLDATYLAWVDFSGTGMPAAEFTARVEKQAKIAVNHGYTFGKGGAEFLRFNFATPRARIVEAVERMQAAFSDLQ